MPIVLAGTKLDALHDQVAIDELNIYAKEMLDDLGLQFYVPTSSKTGEGVDKIFTHIIDTLLTNLKPRNEGRNDENP